MITDISQLDPSGRYTYADYLDWAFEEWVELLNGQYRVFNKPGKSPFHQQVTASVGREIAGQIRQPFYDSWFVPLPIILGYQPEDESIDLIIPDVVVIHNQPPNVLIETGWKGIPVLIVEVADQRTTKIDTTLKFDLYRQYGVPEYWIVLLDERTIQVFTLQDRSYTLANTHETGNVSSLIFPNLTIAYERIFR